MSYKDVLSQVSELQGCPQSGQWVTSVSTVRSVSYKGVLSQVSELQMCPVRSVSYKCVHSQVSELQVCPQSGQ